MTVKNKALKVVVALALCILLSVNAIVPCFAEIVYKGDVNGDKQLNSLDTAEFYKSLLTDAPVDYDANEDGVIDIRDLVRVKKLVAKFSSTEKFNIKFPHTDSFLYRLGNRNSVTLGSLFKAVSNIDSAEVGVVIREMQGSATATYTANTDDWTKGTINFTGTGVVRIIIHENSVTTAFNVEVIDAVNATTATNATANNVVLLNDCGFSSIEVSGGYTLYGNGFTMTCASDSYALDFGYSFVTLNNGTLDNVQIVCPNFDYAALYKNNLTSSDNRSYTDGSGKTRYYNAKSGVMVSGNSQILNSRISGARAAVNVIGGNAVIDNSRIELGAVASILVGSANSLVLRDTTLIQKAVPSTYNPDKSLMGFSVLYLCDASGNATPTTIEGSFVQQAWITEEDSKYVPSEGKSIVSTVLKEEEYLHDIDGDNVNESLNLGFAYMPDDPTVSINEPENITDNRSDKDTVPYAMKAVKITVVLITSTVYVYSYSNSNGTDDSFKTEKAYIPNRYSDIITVDYADTAEGLTSGKSYSTSGWVYELNVDLDKISGYAIDFNKLTMTVNGVTVTDYKVNGETKPTTPITVSTGGTEYLLTATLNDKEYSVIYKVTGTETSKDSPSLVAANYKEGKCVASSYGGTWHGAAPALEGVQIRYWSVAEKQYKTINLADYTPTTSGKLNGTNTTWTFSPDNNDFTLTLTGGQVHSSNNVYAMPVVCDGTLYFVASNSKGLVNTGNGARTISVSYEFKDNNNGEALKFSHAWSVAENKSEQYSYSDFCNGKLTQLTSGGGCVTPDTMISLADGTQKRIDEVTYNDNLLVWDFYKGKYAVVPASIIFNMGTENYNILTLHFSDTTEVRIINGHRFFDKTLNQFVLINESNVADYIGHSFIKMDKNGYETVELIEYSQNTEYTTSYSMLSAYHYNFVVEGMLSDTFHAEDAPLFDYFKVGNDMKYDAQLILNDIEKYGLYTYEDFKDYLTYEQFVALNVRYMKISVGKGQFSYDGILDLINLYLNK